MKPPRVHAPRAESLSVLLDADPFWEVLPVPFPSAHPDLVPRTKAIRWEGVPQLQAKKLWLVG